MSSNPPSPVDLARQGDLQAITFLINQSLKSKGITAKPILEGNRLTIILESPQIPEQQIYAPLIFRGITKLGIDSVRKLKIYGRDTSGGLKSWQQEFTLTNHNDIQIDQELRPSSSKSDSLQVENPESEKVNTGDKQKNRVIIVCNGSNGNLILNESNILIERTGGFLSSYKKGFKQIEYHEIKNIQYVRPNIVLLGYIYFQLASMPSEISAEAANTHENAVSLLDANLDKFDKAVDWLRNKLGLKSVEIAESSKVKPASNMTSSKVTVKNYSKVKVHYFHGKTGSLILKETGLEIHRAGGWLSSHTAGEKSIPYTSITAVQFKKAGFSNGYLQLSLKGGVESKGGAFEAASDENTIVFGAETEAKFMQAKKMIEEKINNSQVSQNTSTTQVERKTSNIDNDLAQLEKLASLKERGIITEEEFLIKKKQILGI